MTPNADAAGAAEELHRRLRRQLDEERTALIAELESHGADPHGEKVDHIVGIDDNFADSAAATAERGEALAFITTARERLADVETALRRMDAGTYGVCELCGASIPAARLNARPLSVRCVGCAAK